MTALTELSVLQEHITQLEEQHLDQEAANAFQRAYALALAQHRGATVTELTEALNISKARFHALMKHLEGPKAATEPRANLKDPIATAAELHQLIINNHNRYQEEANELRNRRGELILRALDVEGAKPRHLQEALGLSRSRIYTLTTNARANKN